MTIKAYILFNEVFGEAEIEDVFESEYDATAARDLLIRTNPKKNFWIECRDIVPASHRCLQCGDSVSPWYFHCGPCMEKRQGSS